MTAAAPTPREPTPEEFARAYDEADMKRIGVWVQENLQQYAGLSWSEGIAREFARLTAEVAHLNGVVEEVAVKLGKERSEVARLTRELAKSLQSNREVEDGRERAITAHRLLINDLREQVAGYREVVERAVFALTVGPLDASAVAKVCDSLRSLPPTPTGDPIDG
jgi:hypothetical protein